MSKSAIYYIEKRIEKKKIQKNVLTELLNETERDITKLYIDINNMKLKQKELKFKNKK